MLRNFIKGKSIINGGKTYINAQCLLNKLEINSMID